MTEEVIVEAPKRDFYLKLTAESDMPTVLSDFYRQDYVTTVDDEGVETQTPDGDPYMVTHTHDYAIDVVGLIHKPTGVTLTDSEGMDYPEMAAVDGWHVNIRLVSDAMRDVVEALDGAYGVTPVTPQRVWL